MPLFSSIQFIQPQDIRLRSRCITTALSKKKISESLDGDASDGEGGVVEKKVRKTTKRAPAKGRRKAKVETLEDSLLLEKAGDITDDEELVPSELAEDSEKPRRRTRKKGIFLAFTYEIKIFSELMPSDIIYGYCYDDTLLNF